MSQKNKGARVMAKAMYDPWSKIVTKNGYAGDEVISALQKSIRRAKEEDACMFAYEMYISSPQLLEKMWRRLLTISVEDIGMGDPMAAVLVNNLYQMSKKTLNMQMVINQCISFMQFATYVAVKKIVQAIY